MANGLPDFASIATNLVVITGAIGAAVAGSVTVIKEMRKKLIEVFEDKDGNVEAREPKQIAGVSIMENTTMLMLSESLRDTRESTDDNTHVLRNIEEAITENTREVSRFREEVRELRHDLALEAARRGRQ